MATGVSAAGWDAQVRAAFGRTVNFGENRLRPRSPSKAGAFPHRRGRGRES